MDAQKKITKARAGLILDHPFFGSIALRLKLTEDNNCETAWTDGITLAYNADYIDSLTLEKTKGLITHEVMHITDMHHLRRQERDPSTWNEACDYTINPLLIKSGLLLPDGALTGYDNSYAEEIYSQIMKQKQQSQDQDSGKCGEVRDYPSESGQGLSEAELSQAQIETKIMVKQAQEMAKAMGNMPSDMDRWVDSLIQPKVDWKSVLQRFMQDISKDDYSWMRPNRRYIHQGLYLPSLYSTKLGNLIVVIDVSGSISQDVLSEFSSELNSILEFYNIDLTVMYCSTHITKIDEFTEDDTPIKLQTTGGGGTDFRPPFDWIVENNKIPIAMLYFTDLECSRFPDEPEYPVLWIYSGRKDKPSAPFGEIVHIK